MTPLIENVWDLIKEESKVYTNSNPSFVFDEDKAEKFKEIFRTNYKKIKEKYMLPSVNSLDRHKVASIIIVSLLETDAISYQDLDPQNIFIGAELLAVKTGLAYLVEKLNEKLSEKGAQKKIEMFKLPNAQSCETPYIEVMCRNLYYAKNDYVLNPLDLAERLFLVEYIALTKEGIDPDILKDY